MATSYQVRSASQHPPSMMTSNSQYGHWSLPASSGKTSHTHTHTYSTPFTGNYNAAARRLGTGVGYTSRYNSTVIPGDLRNFVLPSRSMTAPTNPSGKFGFFEKGNSSGRGSPVTNAADGYGKEAGYTLHKPYDGSNTTDLSDLTASSSLRKKNPLTEVGNLRPTDSRASTRDSLYNKFSDVSLCNDGSYSKSTGTAKSYHQQSKYSLPLEDKVTSYSKDLYGLAESKPGLTLERAYTALDESSFSRSRDLGYERAPNLERSQTFHGQFPSSSKSDSLASDGRLGVESTLGKTTSHADGTHRRNFFHSTSENRPSSPLSVSESRQSSYNRPHPPVQWMFGGQRHRDQIIEPPKTPYQPSSYLYHFESSKLQSPRSAARENTIDVTHRSNTSALDNGDNYKDLLIPRRTPYEIAHRGDEHSKSYLDFPESASNLTTGTYSFRPTPPSSAVPSSGTIKKSILKKTSKYGRDGSATFPRSYARESSYLSGVSTGPQPELPHLASVRTVRRSSSRRVTFNL